ncbi:MAG: fibronectin type III domain-containing protein [Prevotella sp.]|jgi:hypothetical protein
MKYQRNRNIKKKFILIAGILMVATTVNAQSPALKQKAERKLNAYFYSYKPKDGELLQPAKMKKLSINDRKATVDITMDEYFAQQEFTKKSVKKIYKKVRKVLPNPYDDYKIQIRTNGSLIDDLATDATRYNGAWGNIEYDGEPWVTNVSVSRHPSHGLYNRHLVVWASHGRYYDNKKGFWKWQRPNLFCTTEDLFTQTIVVPYLIPMLENAGANVFTPRERDWQTEEVIVDNNGCSNASYYKEIDGRDPWVNAPEKGFAWHSGNYQMGENPFANGTVRMNLTQKKEKNLSQTVYRPNIPKDGRYAVYVSYATVEGSVPDAEYIVYHKGQETRFHVNQRMGGGTWVYLGTFEFDRGCSAYNQVVVTNLSKKKGIVTTDAVRFGGGMGNIERGGTTSGLPRCLEGARYYAQWAGTPYRYYSTKNGADDYGDDINVRSLMSNWLGGGSVYMPLLEGKKVPLELSLAVHSDAGYAPNGTDIIGSLAICTTDFNDGRLNSGVSRQTSKDFAKALLNGIMRDIPSTYQRWNRRYLWDRNYSETRLPEVPSAIIETMSHQNFPDMLLGQDPNFRFTLARSLYKTILRFVNGQHGRSCIVQPLPPIHFSAMLNEGKARLTWAAQDDELEPTAHPTSYIVYIAAGNSGFDNGTVVKRPFMEVELTPGVVYNFRVTAVNRGGESFPSEVLSVCYEPKARKTILIVDGFQRLSAPAVINNSLQQGFDLDADEGVSYGLTAGWSGKQLSFNRENMGSETETGLGYSGNELAGHFIMGNTFDYVRSHANDIAASHLYNIVSCSRTSAETGSVRLTDFQGVDLILGLQKYTPQATEYFKAFSSQLQQQLNAFCAHGGGLLVSGSYVGSDMLQPAETSWLNNVLHCSWQESVRSDSLGAMSGMGVTFDIINQPNPDHYSATHTDVLNPTAPAFCSMKYSNDMSAAVAYNGGSTRTFTMGFPFEVITSQTTRRQLMKGIWQFLLK